MRSVTRQALPVRTSTFRCFAASSRFMGLLRKLYPSLAAARPWPVIGNASGKGQQLPSAATPSRTGALPPPPAGVGEAKPSPNAPARPVLRGRGAHFLREQRWDRTLHTPQRPPCEREDPHRTPRLGPSAAAAGCGVPGRRRGEGERRLPFSPAQRARPPAGPGNEARARGNPSIREPGPPNSTAPARACGGFGEGGPARSRTVTQPQRNRRVGTCRPGGRGRRGPRYCPAPSGVRPVPAAHAPCARPRPSGRSLPAVSARS